MSRGRAIGWLVLVCLVWGISFTATKIELRYASPQIFLGLRFLLATAAVAGGLRGLANGELRAGLILGALFWAGFAFQTAGLRDTTPSRSAFITILSTPLVPLLQFLIFRRTPRFPTLVAVPLAVLGTYLLTGPGGGSGVNRGDLLTLGCALMFAGQIVAVGHFARRYRVERLLALELGTTAVLSFAAAPVLEHPRLELGIPFALLLLFLAFTGLWSFLMQLKAQQVLTPTHTALIFTLEPVFASLVSFLIIGERLAPLQLAGGAMILGAVAAPVLEREAVGRVSAGHPEPSRQTERCHPERQRGI